jgi:hypothetical protein
MLLGNRIPGAGVFMLLVSLAASAAGCSDGGSSDADCPTTPTDQAVLQGQMPWGQASLSAASNGHVTGALPWGCTDLSWAGNRIQGISPWGGVDVQEDTFSDHAHLTGPLPWGQADVLIDAGSVNGTLPWGQVSLHLSGIHLGGTLPWGSADLHLVSPAHSMLLDPIVLLALTAMMSDKT